MSKWRGGVDSNLTPLQQSLTVDDREYLHYKMSNVYVGVVLEIHPSDAPTNRSALQSSDRRGYLAEAKVLVVGTNASSNLILDHVAISQPFPAGLDNYYEFLPRPSTTAVTGEDLESSGGLVDPYDLDGDWCLVMFVGGNLDQPVIISWWPHPRNRTDPSTTGTGNPDSSGAGKALDQSGRYLHRVNGVEFVVTKKGDVYLSTALANSTLKFTEGETSEKGRWPRNTDPEEGGSILLELKPSQSLEVSWEEKKDGVGILRTRDSSLPQTNPPPRSEGDADSEKRQNLYIHGSKEDLELQIPNEMRVKCRTRIRFLCEDETTIESSNVLTLESAQILLGENADASQGVVRGKDLYDWLSTMTVLTATGPASINPSDLSNFIAATVSTKTVVE